MAGFTLRVTPSVMRQISGEFQSTLQEAERHLNAVLDISARSRGYWQGETGDRDREGYGSFREDIASLFRTLRNYPRDLQLMAGLYQSAENDAVASHTHLKTNQIV